MQTITYHENASPEAVARVEAARAKLKPCCTRCRKTLPKREIEKRLCSDRNACTLRSIQRRSDLKALYGYKASRMTYKRS